PTPRLVASNSTPNNPAVEPAPVIEMTTQFCDGRGVGNVGCSARLTLFAAATGNVVPLLRFRYIQPAASPAGEFNGGYVPLAVDVRDVSGSVIVAGTDGEMMMPPLNVIGFSCSSKRTISARIVASRGAVERFIVAGEDVVEQDLVREVRRIVRQRCRAT